MDVKRYKLLEALSDGAFHSGEALGAALNIGRSAIWKHMKALEALGLNIFAVQGRGYKLSAPLILLNRHEILQKIPVEILQQIKGLDIQLSIPSTNASLLERAPMGLPMGFVCLAEHQSQGRGRRGRNWVSPFAANLYLSILWRFDPAPEPLSSLSLAIAVSVLRALQSAGLQGCELKWPNDILHKGNKLAGILLEMGGETAGPCYVVAGVGINVNMSESAEPDIDQAWTDIAQISSERMDRNELAALVMTHLVNCFQEFEQNGLSSFRDEWEQNDMLRGKIVRVSGHKTLQEGHALGIDDQGALIFKTKQGIQFLHAGEVSIKL